MDIITLAGITEAVYSAHPTAQQHAYTVSPSSCCCVCQYDSLSAFNTFMLHLYLTFITSQLPHHQCLRNYLSAAQGRRPLITKSPVQLKIFCQDLIITLSCETIILTSVAWLKYHFNRISLSAKTRSQIESVVKNPELSKLLHLYRFCK